MTGPILRYLWRVRGVYVCVCVCVCVRSYCTQKQASYRVQNASSFYRQLAVQGVYCVNFYKCSPYEGDGNGGIIYALTEFLARG